MSDHENAKLRDLHAAITDLQVPRSASMFESADDYRLYVAGYREARRDAAAVVASLASPEMVNGLTQDETDATASVMGLVTPQQPAYWQWRRKHEPWSTERTFDYEVFATTDDSEVRPLFVGPQVGPELAMCPACFAEVRDPQAALTPTREPQPLTDAKIDEIFYENHTIKDHPWVNWRRFARAILAAASKQGET